MSESDFEDLAAETLSGDLRDVVLTHIRSMETPWSKMSEAAQNDKIYAVTNATETIVRRAVSIIAAREQDTIFCKVTKFTVKDGIKAELVAASSVQNIERIAENISQPAIMVFASPEEYIGQRSEPKADKDQPELPIVEGEDDEAEEDELPEADPADVPEVA
ncbi:hypothetical protein MRS76_11365 [Rhizobiaceae bacterium n13]|uniref:hypothetical protein n=1 Tax=Ferirhizobium litorale TaxID=2927786 RepID=UPI0024B2CADD|nr:hypothetical protein [Fererhizobium litorale]MDI7862560.1 hypothetical protein [Fererhizobium litorale]